MNVLVACEESQTVCKAFRERGFFAFSCDIKPCSGGFPEWHIQDDALKYLNGGVFITCDGKSHIVPRWDLLIAHPPCTYLTFAANHMHSLKCVDNDSIVSRTSLRLAAMAFFMRFMYSNALFLAIENPVGIMNSAFRRPDQIIHPYYFSSGPDDIENYVTKTTCLWLRNLPCLVGSDLPVLSGSVVSPPLNADLFGVSPSGKAYCWTEKISCSDRASFRSKTFPGVAFAMAAQWGDYVKGV